MGTDVSALRRLEGLEVEVEAVGARFSHAILISARGGRTRTLWLEVEGEDVFLPFERLLEMRPSL